ncbi:hypothetical protein R1flu_024680 [Riccia fluitans]|uniref:BRCT domain-containing protein n=1 Tax=Riccia fluitans TaxID=41844 RepID=A0ABD1XZN9_9MARC
MSLECSDTPASGTAKLPDCLTRSILEQNMVQLILHGDFVSGLDTRKVQNPTTKNFGVSELKEVILELQRETEQCCQTCWPTTIYSQGSFTERKVYCCSKFVKADAGGKMTSPQKEDEESGIFYGVRFLLAGFEPAHENQFIEVLEANGGVNTGTYDSSCTHVIVSNLGYDDPICAAARKDSKALVTDAWVADCLDSDALADVNHVLYRPLKDLDGIPGSEDLCICLTGYQGQARQRIMRMVELIGARFTKPLLGNIVTHLVCYKFEGEKYELAKKTGLKLVNHFWLEDSLKSWSLLPEEDYGCSGWDVENGAKQVKVTKVARTPMSIENAKRRKSGSTAEFPSPSPFDLETNSRRNSDKFDNENLKVRSPPSKASASPARSLSGQHGTEGKKTEQDLSEVEVPKQRVSTPEIAPLVTSIRGNSFHGLSSIIPEAMKTADPQDESSPASEKKSRRSSCGVNQTSPSTPGFRLGTAPVDHCATIDCDMEEMHISVGSSRRKRISGVEENVDRIEHVASERNTVGYESPESNRRKSSKSGKLGLSPSVTKDLSSRGLEHPAISPAQHHVSSPSDAPASGKLRKQKFLRNEKEMLQEMGGIIDLTNMEVCEPSKFLASPENKRLAKDTVDVQSPKEVSRSAQSSSPLSYPAAADGCMEDAVQTHHSMRKSKVAVQKPGSAIKLRQSVKDNEVNLEQRSVPDEGGSVKGASSKFTPTKGSRSFHSTLESSWRSVDNEAAQVEEQDQTRYTTMHDIPTKSGGFNEPAKKSRKVVSSHSRDKSAQKKAGILFSEPQNEDSPDDRKKKAEELERVTRAEADVSLAEWGKDDHSSMNFSSDFSRGEEVDERETKNAASRHKDTHLKSNDREMSTTTEVQAPASLSKSEKDHDRKSTNGRDCNNYGEQNKENVGLQRSKENHSTNGVAPKKSSKKGGARVSLLGTTLSATRRCFAVGGSSDQRNNLHYLIKLLGAKVCKSRYEWKDDVTHIVLPVPLRRTEKFLAGAAAGRWILKPEYVQACRDAGRFLEEEQYEWYGAGTNDKGSISFEAPRKWRTQFADTGCGAFYGLRVLFYGHSTSPPSDTLNRAIRAGGGFVLATTPPYFQHLADGVDFVIINGVLVNKQDKYVQEFLQHKVACVSYDYFVDYICHPSSSLDKHILYNTHAAVAGAQKRLQKNIMRGPNEEVEKLRVVAAQNLSTSQPKRMKEEDDIACAVCGRTDDENVMLLCGDDKGRGCGLATHIHCCSPPLSEVPEEDWFCRNCEDL